MTKRSKMIVPDKSDRIQSIEMKPGFLHATALVTWRPDVKTKFGWPWPTLSEKIEALRRADELSCDVVEFPYPGSAIRRCRLCSWPSAGGDKMTCHACYALERAATVFASVREKVRERASPGEMDLRYQMLEGQMDRLARTVQALQTHVVARGLEPERSATPGTETWECEMCSAIVVALVTIRPVCPSCRQEMRSARAGSDLLGLEAR